MLPLIDAATRELLLANGRDRERDHYPVIKLFNPAGPATWLICAMEADGDTLFGCVTSASVNPNSAMSAWMSLRRSARVSSLG